MEYNSKIHHRRPIRLKGYDYSQTGAYYFTFCVQRRFYSLGFVRNGKVDLFPPGKMVKNWWLKLPEKFPNIKLDVYVIMPEHFHGIIHIINGNGGGIDSTVHPSAQQRVDAPLSQIVQWFKTMTTNEYMLEVKQSGWFPCDRRFWQRGYYEHVVRNATDLNRIRNYIINNPVNWGMKHVGITSKRKTDDL
jgi:REP element-mobilizing transposase RayT